MHSARLVGTTAFAAKSTLRATAIAALLTYGACTDEQSKPNPGDRDAAMSDDGDVAHEVTGLHGSVTPRYFIARTVYSPPASTFPNCLEKGSIEYLGGSALGTVLSAEASFAEGYASKTREPLALDRRVGTFGYEATGAGIDIGKPSDAFYSLDGDCNADGVDHDRDWMMVWFNPKLDVVISDDTVSWTLDLESPGRYAELTLGSLKHPERLSSRDKLTELGISDQDLADIAAQHPFREGTPDSLDPDRFVPFNKTPEPYGPSGGSVGYEIETPPETDPFEPAKATYSVPLTIDGDEAFTARMKEVLQDAERWTWTSSSHHEMRQSNDLVARIRLGTPGQDYKGPGYLTVYYDTIYRSFAFILGDWKED